MIKSLRKLRKLPEPVDIHGFIMVKTIGTALVNSLLALQPLGNKHFMTNVCPLNHLFPAMRWT
ncbi:MAG: hypothetical protein AAFY48_24980, partial [Bacteroidota bacterium]